MRQRPGPGVQRWAARWPVRASFAVVWLAIAALGLSACGGDDPTDPSDGLTGRLTIFAASSLTDAFKEIGAAFEAEHPAVDLEINTAASSALRTQIESGARADLFASANERHAAALAEANHTTADPLPIAMNEVVVVVPRANPAGITEAAEIARLDITLLLAAEDVPVGTYARAAIRSFGADGERDALANVISYEQNARALLAKIQLGEADAGIVYATDALAAADDVIAIPFRRAAATHAVYWIVPLADGRNPAAADAFITFVRSNAGQTILERHGFARI